MDWRRVTALIGFLVLTITQGYGCVALKWSFPNITAMYIIFMILLALLFQFRPQVLTSTFLDQLNVAKDILIVPVRPAASLLSNVPASQKYLGSIVPDQ